MNKSIFDNISFPKIEFSKKDRSIVAYSERKTFERQKVMVTYIWEDKEPTLINVLSKKEYISKNIKTGKTTTRGTLSKHILGRSNYGCSIAYDATCKNESRDKFIAILDRDIIKRLWISDSDTVFQIVERYINQLNNRVENEQKQRFQKRSDKYFNEFKEPRFSEEFLNFSRKWIRENDRLFISKNKRNGLYKGYCSHCGWKFSLTHYNYVGERVVCPFCGEVLSFRFDHNNDTKIMFAANVGYFEKINGEPALRLFHIYRRKRGANYEDLEPKDFKEYARYVITEKKVFCWFCECRYGMGNHWVECGWYSTGFRVLDNYFAVFNNLPSLKIRTPLLKYKTIIEQRAHTDTELFKIIAAQRKYPSIEYLQTQGWTNLVLDVIRGDALKTLNPNGKNATEVFGIDVNKVKKYGIRINALQLHILKLADKANLTIDSDVLDYLKPNCDRLRQVRLTEKLFRFVKPIKFVHYSQGQKIQISDYCDYLDQLTTLNYDMKSEINLYPKDFHKAHTEMSLLITAHQKKIFETAVETVFENYHTLCEWTKDGYTVLMAKNCAEIVREGATQNHCVGNYCERVAKNESIILFLRRADKPDEAFYTMEIRPDMKKLNIIQCRGYKNSDPSPEIRAEVDAFLKKYERWFNRRPATGFDKNSIVSKYYKAVHKTEDGRYFSGWDRKTEYVIGEESITETDTNPDLVAVKGLHIASLEFAQNYGGGWSDVAILEVEVNMNDVIVPDAKDQIRTSRFKVIREVPMSEMGEWGEKHLLKQKKTAKVAA